MKRKITLAIMTLALIVCLHGCFLPLVLDSAFTVTILDNAQRPPFTVRLEMSTNEPGVYMWYGPWGVESTTNVNWYETEVTEFSNPMMFDADWTNGSDIDDPEPEFITFENRKPVIAGMPRFSTNLTIGSEQQGSFIPSRIYTLQPGQFYTIDFRNCAIDLDGDEVTLKELEFITFHKDGYRPPQFKDAYPDIVKQWEDKDVNYVDEGRTPFFSTPYDTAKIQWKSVEGVVGYQPRWPEIIPDGNGLPYAPFRFQVSGQYPFYSSVCNVRLFDKETLPTGGCVVRALFSDGSLQTWGEWIWLVGPQIGCPVQTSSASCP